MTHAPAPTRPDTSLAGSPATLPEAIAAWPTDRPLAALLSGQTGQPRSRFSLLAEPAETRFIRAGAPEGHADPFDQIDALPRQSSASPNPPGPFGPGWLLNLRYELGFAAEPKAGDLAPGTLLATASRIDSGRVLDNTTGQWSTFGSPPAWQPPSPAAPPLRTPLESPRADRYTDSVARAIELIHAGDAFQINLAHPLRTDAPPARTLAAALLGSAAPWYGAIVETPADTVVSASPELFLDVTPDGAVTTRPMKGTRARTGDPAELASAPKDRAELAMIVDLMRNDLGRIARFGSVRVTEPHTVETHGGHAGVHQGVATVCAQLREDVTLGGLLRATFPPGSVTGAPKVRAMQIIRESEGFARGPYCGSVGFIRDDGRAVFNVAIRTASIAGDELTYPVGAGIVADSDPDAELAETLDKAGVLRDALDNLSGRLA